MSFSMAHHRLPDIAAAAATRATGRKILKSQVYHINLHSRLMLLRIFYEVATISRLLKMIGLFCKRALLKRLYSAAAAATRATGRHSQKSAVYSLYTTTVNLFEKFLVATQATGRHSQKSAHYYMYCCAVSD